MKNNNKSVLISSLDKEIARLYDTNEKQRISEAHNLESFKKLFEKSSIEEIAINSKSDKLNLGIYGIAIIKSVLGNIKTMTFTHEREEIATDNNGNGYQLATIIKSRSATPQPSRNKKVKNFMYLIFTPTYKGIYIVPMQKILDLHKSKISANDVVKNGKLIKSLA